MESVFCAGPGSKGWLENARGIAGATKIHLRGLSFLRRPQPVSLAASFHSEAKSLSAVPAPSKSQRADQRLDMATSLGWYICWRFLAADSARPSQLPTFLNPLHAMSEGELRHLLREVAKDAAACERHNICPDTLASCRARMHGLFQGELQRAHRLSGGRGGGSGQARQAQFSRVGFVLRDFRGELFCQGGDREVSPIVG